MERLIDSKAIILKGQDLGESNRIITLLTQGMGKLKVVAYGAKKSKRRFQNALEPFTYGMVRIKTSRTGGLHTLESLTTKDLFIGIRRDVVKYACAGLALELTDLWTRENAPEKDLFQLLTWFLKTLEKEGDPYRITLFFKAKLLNFVGYGPDWARFKGHDHHLSQATIKSLVYIQYSPLEKVQRLRLAKAHMREAWALLKAMHTRHLEKEPHSYNVLRQMTQGGQHLH